MVRQFFARLADHPAERDAVIGGCWLVLGVVLVQFGGYGLWSTVQLFDGPGWMFLLIAGAFAVIATQRSKHPIGALLCGLGIAGIDVAGGGSLLAALAITDLIYAAVKYVTDRGIAVLLGLAITWVALAALVLLIWRANAAALLSVELQWAAIFSISGLWGWNVRSERVRTSTQLSAQHAHETQRLRTRVAHDLHDLVANQIAVAGLHIEAAKLQAAGHGGLNEAALLKSLERAKRGTDQAHAELRRLISALGAIDEIAETPMGPVTDEVAALGDILPVGRALFWGEGSRALFEDELAVSERTTAALMLRVLRELMANSAKHGVGDTRCEADTVAAAGEAAAEFHLTIRNAVRSARAGDEQPGNRLGLRGITLVLDGLGGSIETGEDPRTGEWVAMLVIPRAHHNTEIGAA